jgi:hypothetical protein
MAFTGKVGFDAAELFVTLFIDAQAAMHDNTRVSRQ